MKTSGTMNSATGHTSVSTRTGNFNDGLYDRAGARPDLDLDFARTKSLKDRVSKEDLITFTRGSGGTYVDESGLVKNARTNIHDHHAEVGPNSLRSGLVSLENPKGQITNVSFWTIAEKYTGLNGSVNNIRSGSQTGNDGSIITGSVYLRTNTGTVTVHIDSCDKNVQTVTVTDQWQRFSATTLGATNVGAAYRFFDMLIYNTAAGGATTLYGWGAQVETGGVATLPVIENTIAGGGAPRFTHDPVTLESKGLLIEQAATNCVPFNRNSNGFWQGSKSTTDSNATNPDGSTPAYHNLSTSENVQYADASSFNTDTLTFSVFIKQRTGSTDHQLSCEIFKQINNPANNNAYGHVNLGVCAKFDVSTGEFVAISNPSNANRDVTNYVKEGPDPNGWYRIGFTVKNKHVGNDSGGNPNTSPNFTATTRFDIQNTTAYIWGPQVEAGNVMTSYIPTDTTQVTRSPDLASIEGDNFGTYRTNKVVQTKQWQLPFSAVASTGAIITRHADANPVTGEYDAIKVTITNVGSDAAIQQNISASGGSGAVPNDGTKVVFSFYARTDSGTLNVKPKLGRQVSNAFNSQSPITVTDQWARYQVNDNGLDAGNSKTHYGLQILDASKPLYTYGWQVEIVASNSSQATEYIPSTDTYTNRQSNATFVDGNGIIRTAHRNLMLYSEAFGVDDTGSLQRWQAGNVQLSYDANHINPDGTAGTFYGNTYTVGNAEREIYSYFPGNEANTDTLTFSLFCKKRDSNSQFIHIQVFASVNDATYGTNSLGVCCIFNPEDGTFHTASGPNDDVGAATAPLVTTTAHSGRIVSNRTAIQYPNDWWRISFTVQLNASSGQSPIFTAGSRYDIQNLHQCYLWGAQVVKGTEAGDYYKTTGTISGPPRYSHDPETLTPTGLYLEPAATNLSKPNRMIGSSITRVTMNSLTEQAAGQNTNGVVGPTGSAVGVIRAHFTGSESSPTGQVYIFNRTGDGSSSNPHKQTTYGTGIHTSSIFVKPGLETKWRVAAHSNYASASAGGAAAFLAFNFTLTGDGTLDSKGTGGIAGSIEKYPNGWYRLSVTYYRNSTASVDSAYGVLLYPIQHSHYNNFVSNTGLTSGELGYFWGPQVETGEVATSYILTNDAEATRAADTFTSTATEVLDRANGTKPAFFTKDGISVFAGLKLNNQRIAPTTSNAVNNTHIYNPVFNLSQSSTSIVSMFPDNYANWTTPPEPRLVVFTGSPTDIYLAANYTEDADLKSTLRFQENNSQLSVNTILYGGIGGGDTSVTMGSPTILYIGHSGGNKKLNGTINRLTLWKTPLPDIKLKNITS